MRRFFITLEVTMSILKKHSLTFQSLLTLVLLGLLSLMLYLTSPKDVGMVGVLAFFMILYALLLAFFHLALDFFSVGKHHKTLFLSAVLAAIPTSVIALKSLGQLQPIDIAFVVTLAVVGIFYWSRTSKIQDS